jgi:SAM-dependent MidA family methyltransferase
LKKASILAINTVDQFGWISSTQYRMTLQAIMLPARNTAANVICREINEAGPISFARFMELALYCPELGFYERFPHRIGRTGDFFTSVSVGPLFGQLLAFQFSRWLETMEPLGARWHMVEAGAHDGQLSLDILTWLNHHAPKTLARLAYLILEPSRRRQSWQRAKLAEVCPDVRWIRDWTELAHGSLHGIIFSNELLDALPVQRYGWGAEAREWFEYGVTLQEGRLAWCRLPRGADVDSALLSQVPESIQPLLADGFVVESVPEARKWWHQAAAALGYGRLVTIDYGRGSSLIPDPARPEGSLRAYRQHRIAPNLLADPGEQDLTAHVDFGCLREAGEAAGLRTLELTSQGRFLVGVLDQAVRLQAPGLSWRRSALGQFQMLTHPEHLGERFKVFVQARDPVDRA